MSGPPLEFFLGCDESGGSDDSVETTFTVLFDGPLRTPEDTISEVVDVAAKEADVHPILEPVIDEPTMSACAEYSNMSCDVSTPASGEPSMSALPQDVSVPTPPIRSATPPVGPHLPEYFIIVYNYAGNLDSFHLLLADLIGPAGGLMQVFNLEPSGQELPSSFGPLHVAQFRSRDDASYGALLLDLSFSTYDGVVVRRLFDGPIPRFVMGPYLQH